ncbi:hypothetical protein DFH29DRAFT_1071863 [Suillus ampliporus]|nr:hypothetical protein DFH29DRAFT_1071863 [Suillus ampliporus]
MTSKNRTKTRTERKASEVAELERRGALRAQREFEAFGPGCRQRQEICLYTKFGGVNSINGSRLKGTLLRPRYAPEWVPSWEGLQHHPRTCEDGHILEFGHIIDATRESDGLYISLKVVDKSEHPHEVDIRQYFMIEQLVSDPKNYCVPFLDVVSVLNEENKQIIVMPLWLHFTRLRFDTVGERPSKYYLIDFGLSRRDDATEENPLEYPIFGCDKSVPEFQKNADVPMNPFPTDIYYLGNIIRQEFLLTSSGFKFLTPLVDDMVQDDPSRRPTMEVVIERFDSIRQQLSTWFSCYFPRRRSFGEYISWN